MVAGLAFNDNVNVPQLYGALRATINELSNRRSTATGLAPVELFDSKGTSSQCEKH